MKSFAIALFCFGAILPTGASAHEAAAHYQVIHADTLKSWLDAKKPVVILDARSKEYDDGKRLPGAKYVPYNAAETGKREKEVAINALQEQVDALEAEQARSAELEKQSQTYRQQFSEEKKRANTCNEIMEQALKTSEKASESLQSEKERSSKLEKDYTTKYVSLRESKADENAKKEKSRADALEERCTELQKKSKASEEALQEHRSAQSKTRDIDKRRAEEFERRMNSAQKALQETKESLNLEHTRYTDLQKQSQANEEGHREQLSAEAARADKFKSRMEVVENSLGLALNAEKQRYTVLQKQSQANEEVLRQLNETQRVKAAAALKLEQTRFSILNNQFQTSEQVHKQQLSDEGTRADKYKSRMEVAENSCRELPEKLRVEKARYAYLQKQAEANETALREQVSAELKQRNIERRRADEAEARFAALMAQTVEQQKKLVTGEEQRAKRQRVEFQIAVALDELKGLVQEIEEPATHPMDLEKPEKPI